MHMALQEKGLTWITYNIIISLTITREDPLQLRSGLDVTPENMKNKKWGGGVYFFKDVK